MRLKHEFSKKTIYTVALLKVARVQSAGLRFHAAQLNMWQETGTAVPQFL